MSESAADVDYHSNINKSKFPLNWETLKKNKINFSFEILTSLINIQHQVDGLDDSVEYIFT